VRADQSHPTRALHLTILLTIRDTDGTIAPTVGVTPSRVHPRISSRARPSGRSSLSSRARSIIPGELAVRGSKHRSSGSGSSSSNNNNNNNNNNRPLRRQPRTATFDPADNAAGFSTEMQKVGFPCPRWQLQRTRSCGHSGQRRRWPCPSRTAYNGRPAVQLARRVGPCRQSSRKWARHNPRCACPVPRQGRKVHPSYPRAPPCACRAPRQPARRPSSALGGSTRP